MVALTQEFMDVGFAAEEELAGRIRRRDMREAGLTFMNVRRCTRELVEDGDLTTSMTPQQIQDTVLNKLYMDNGRAFARFRGPDWNAILEFFTKLLPLIMQLIAIFGV